jgi:hypothetical protein
VNFLFAPGLLTVNSTRKERIPWLEGEYLKITKKSFLGDRMRKGFVHRAINKKTVGLCRRKVTNTY